MAQKMVKVKESSKKEIPPMSNFERYWNSQFLDESFEDWLIHLQSRDKLSLTDELTNSSENTWPLGDSFSPSVISSIVYKWCQQLKQPMGVPHRTVELYERFFRIHYRSSFVSTSAIDSLKPNMSNKSQWQEIYTEIRHQSLLYLVSCLQIASKLENGYKVVTVPEAAMLLRQAHRPCECSTIINSEVLVLVTLRHDVDYPPINDYVDILICQLIIVLKKTPESLKSRQLLSVIDEIYEVAILFINVIFFDRQIIVKRILAGLINQNAEGASSAHQRQVQFDKVLLAAGVVSAATFLVQSNSASQVMKELHLRTSAHPSDMAIVSSVLVIYLDSETGK